MHQMKEEEGKGQEDGHVIVWSEREGDARWVRSGKRAVCSKWLLRICETGDCNNMKYYAVRIREFNVSLLRRKKGKNSSISK